MQALVVIGGGVLAYFMWKGDMTSERQRLTRNGTVIEPESGLVLSDGSRSNQASIQPNITMNRQYTGHMIMPSEEAIENAHNPSHVLTMAALMEDANVNGFDEPNEQVMARNTPAFGIISDGSFRNTATPQEVAWRARNTDQEKRRVVLNYKLQRGSMQDQQL